MARRAKIEVWHVEPKFKSMALRPMYRHQGW